MSEIYETKELSHDLQLDGQQLWQKFLDNVQIELSHHVFNTWLKPIRYLAIDGDTLNLAVSDQFFKDWINEHYLAFIAEKLAELHPGTTLKINLAIAPLKSTSNADGTTTVADASHHEDEPPAELSHTVSSSLNNEEERKTLNPRYIFDNFVAGPSNQFAFAACKAVAENPGSSYNPLFIFGGVGLGKTHLLSAIGHHFLQKRSLANVIYASAEQFTNEVVNAVLSSKLEEFRSKYRQNCDIILIDDIQLISGKERTQHEFFHIFNTLYDSQRQIVVTSDKLPHEIPEIEERLRNRFQWGLIADIQPPEIETRVAIIRKKTATEGVNLSDEVCFFLAKNIRSNVRELEGALIRLLAHASLTKNPINVDYTRHVLADILNNKTKQLSVDAIQKVVSSYFQIKLTDLKGARRHKNLVKPRQISMYLARKHTGASYPDLGSRFGDKDHTTIMSAYKKIENSLKSDAELRMQILELERQLDVTSIQA